MKHFILALLVVFSMITTPVFAQTDESNPDQTQSARVKESQAAQSRFAKRISTLREERASIDNSVDHNRCQARIGEIHTTLSNLEKRAQAHFDTISSVHERISSFVASNERVIVDYFALQEDLMTQKSFAQGLLTELQLARTNLTCDEDTKLALLALRSQLRDTKMALIAYKDSVKDLVRSVKANEKL